MGKSASPSEINTFIEQLKSEFLFQEYQKIDELLKAHFDKTKLQKNKDDKS